MADLRDRGPGSGPGLPAKTILWAATGLGAFIVIVAVGFALFSSIHHPEPLGLEPTVKAEDRSAPVVSSMPASPAAETLRGNAPLSPKIPAYIPTAEPELTLNNLAGTLRVHMMDTAPGQRIPLEHTCYRNNQSPALSWNGAPHGSRSLVAVLEKQQNRKKPVWLWELFDINPAAGSLPAGLPPGGQLDNGTRQAKNMYGRPEYTGPCEPRGAIPYALRLFALDDVPNLPPAASRDELVRAMNGHIIDATEMDFVHYLKF